MTRMPLSDKSGARGLAYDGAFLCAALMLSFAESVLLPAGILPFPGTKPGLANAAILLCAETRGKARAGAVSLARLLISFFLFGSGTSVLYSLAGAALSFVGILLVCTIRSPFSFLGKSLVCAALHNVGQLLCALLLIGEATVLLMTPWMLIASQICGAFTGIILNLVYTVLFKRNRKESDT